MGKVLQHHGTFFWSPFSSSARCSPEEEDRYWKSSKLCLFLVGASKASNCLIGNKSNNSSVHDKNAKCLKELTTAYDSKLGECSDQGHYVALGHNNASGRGHCCFRGSQTAGDRNTGRKGVSNKGTNRLYSLQMSSLELSKWRLVRCSWLRLKGPGSGRARAQDNSNKHTFGQLH